MLRCGDHQELVRLTRSSSVRAGLAQRARIVLLASEGMKNEETAAVMTTAMDKATKPFNTIMAGLELRSTITQ